MWHSVAVGQEIFWVESQVEGTFGLVQVAPPSVEVIKSACDEASIEEAVDPRM
jgi:hypothetical protein